jgi:hypothetical protein
MYTRLYSAFFVIILLSNCIKKEERTISTKRLYKSKEFSFPGRINRFFVDNNSIHIVGSPYEIVKSYNDDGELIKETGKKGPANWEISSVWWYDENDSIYTIYDYGKNLINRFDSKNDSLQISFKFANQSNIHKAGPHSYLTTLINELGEFEFGLIDIEEKAIIHKFPIKEQLKELRLQDIKDLDFLLYGDFIRSEESSETFIYYCLNAPLFFKIDLERMDVALFKDFRFEFMPEIYRSGNTVVITPRQNWFVSGAIFGQEIFFLTVKNNDYIVEANSKWFLDCYDLTSGQYQESIDLSSSEEDLGFPFEIKNKNGDLVIGWNFEKINIYKLSDSKIELVPKNL